jgi:hypothetical protein
MPGGGDQVNGPHDAVPAVSTIAEEEVRKSERKGDLIFAVFAGNAEQLEHAILLAESIRTFAGRYKDNPVWIFVPHGGIDPTSDLGARLTRQAVELHESTTPDEASWFPYASKVFAAAQAEARAEGWSERMAWLDEDTIVLREPGAFSLRPGLALAYRPVMHRNIGSLYSDPVDDFWARIYRGLAVPDAALFPMITPADGDIIRPYFNAGLLVVRPERSILRRWAEDLLKLASDSSLVAQCRQEVRKRIFLHQTALVGAILNLVGREEMLELPGQYNYPLFFQEMYGADRAFDDIAGVVTLRYDVYFRDPAPDWRQRLKGPPEKLSWLIDRLGA